MSSVKTVFIRTDGTGAYTYERAFKGAVLGIEIVVGDLSTPDVDVTDGTYSKTLLSVDGVAADTMYVPSSALETSAGVARDVSDEDESDQPAVNVGAFGPGIIMGTLKVAVTGGGANKKGRVNILFA